MQKHACIQKTTRAWYVLKPAKSKPEGLFKKLDPIIPQVLFAQQHTCTATWNAVLKHSWTLVTTAPACGLLSAQEKAFSACCWVYMECPCIYQILMDLRIFSKWHVTDVIENFLQVVLSAYTSFCLDQPTSRARWEMVKFSSDNDQNLTSCLDTTKIWRLQPWIEFSFLAGWLVQEAFCHDVLEKKHNQTTAFQEIEAPWSYCLSTDLKLHTIPCCCDLAIN